jgi:hypothetical protein
MSFEEPVDVMVYSDGSLLFSDGHHRVMAGKILDACIPVTVRQGPKVTPEVWQWYRERIAEGHGPLDVNPGRESKLAALHEDWVAAGRPKRAAYRRYNRALRKRLGLD